MKSSCPALVTALAFILVMALTLIIFGKKNETVRLTKDAEYAEQAIVASALKIKEEQYVLDLLEKDMKVIEINVDKEGKTLKDMTGENQKKAAEKEACQKLQNELSTALGQVQQEKTKLEEDFKASKAQWSEEKNKLLRELEQTSPVCAFVMKDSKAAKLCNFTAAPDMVTLHGTTGMDKPAV